MYLELWVDQSTKKFRSMDLIPKIIISKFVSRIHILRTAIQLELR